MKGGWARQPPWRRHVWCSEVAHVLHNVEFKHAVELCWRCKMECEISYTRSLDKACGIHVDPCRG
eukprot:scaffold82742_cov31-Tisochrysis_lutea.AAC.2